MKSINVSPEQLVLFKQVKCKKKLRRTQKLKNVSGPVLGKQRQY